MHARWELPPGRGRAPVEKEHGVRSEEPKDILRVRVRTQIEQQCVYGLYVEILTTLMSSAHEIYYSAPTL